ncbi:hypothetical protein CHL78_007830 [Romboutsia weinsteinii]|uniref:Uncharacterized protein n=1 Tax=Romboutsia weinsteinii TaxID=2020949 RepID=A0A371J5D9_9FIRM|nr:hypothetical protein [Romboutsia weinsteinii]RDY27903.1 hypothetical protein CHL78_007830 [Romboutsia weinsteinii]
MNFEMNNPSLKFISTNDVYEAIDRCNSKVLRITYCSLTINNQCSNTKTEVIKVNRVDRSCGIIEGQILRNNQPVEDIILRDRRILRIECVQGSTPPGPSPIFDIIKNCKGFVRITECTQLVGGQCQDRRSYPFLVTDVDERNNTIKGFRISGNQNPEFIILDASLILRVECLSQGSNPNLPWMLIPILLQNKPNR